jgi:hypothetical protein
LLPTAPATVSGVLATAWRLYLAVLPRCFPLLLLAVLAMSALSAVLVPPQLDTLTLENLVLVRDYLLSPRVWLAGAGIGAITLFLNNAIFLLADATAQGRRVSLLAAAGGALRRWFPALAVGVVFAVLVSVGTLLFVVPGIYLSGVYQFGFVAAAIGSGGVEAALRESRLLVRGHWLRAAMPLSIGITVVALLTMTAEGALGAMTFFAGSGVRSVLLAQQLLLGALDLVLLPYVPVVMLCTWYDLRLRAGWVAGAV